jgi:hypothetical protein
MHSISEFDVDDYRDEMREYVEMMSDMADTDKELLVLLKQGINQPSEIEVVDCSGYDEVDYDVDVQNYE